MIEKIDDTQRVHDYNCRGIPRIRPMSSIEKEIVNKVNELVDKFNEVFPL